MSAPSVPSVDTFPRQQARTQRFTLGRPRKFHVAPDGSRVLFLRAAPRSRTTCLWSWELTTDGGLERLLVDPSVLLASGSDEQVSAEEKARRERAREMASGIVGYATDDAFTVAAFALAGRLYAVDLGDGTVRELASAGGAFDPRPNGAGTHVAYVAGGALRVIDLRPSPTDRTLAAELDAPEVTWGAAEFVASEEMGRFRGYWWSPDGEKILAARADSTGVQKIHIADPAHPTTPAQTVAYPAAGTANAVVSLSIVALDGTRVDVAWDNAALPYLVNAWWGDRGDPLVVVQSRDQRTVHLLEVDPATGACELVHEVTDERWWEIVDGVPGRLPDGQLVWVLDDGDTRRLTLDGKPVTPVGLQVRAVADLGPDGVLFTASTEPTEVHLWLLSPDGPLTQLTDEAGVHGGSIGGGTRVVISQTLAAAGARITVHRGEREIGTIASHAELPLVTPAVTMLSLGQRQLRAAVLLPTGHVAGSARLPVLLAPYGGPGAQRVLAAQDAFLSAQWLADQGFAVLVADGRGTPGRGPAWEREIAGDFASAPLADQVTALHAAAALDGDFDLTRVAIMGWSFGGYLSALAVLREPDVFHAAVAGAPVTDWTLYDTHYTERYLGTDATAPAYAASSLLADAPRLNRPLLIIHGLADDNVVVANTLRLSSALLAAGRPHSVLPLSGVTHMTPQEEVAENLLLLQVEFLRRALGA